MASNGIIFECISERLTTLNEEENKRLDKAVETHLNDYKKYMLKEKEFIHWYAENAESHGGKTSK